MFKFAGNMDISNKSTEQSSLYSNLEQMDTLQLLQNMNREDQTVAAAVQMQIPAIKTLVDQVVLRMQQGGRLFYLGAGTSGRLGVVDASECPPTFGVEQGRVIGLIAGGDAAIRKAVENAEDDTEMGWKDLQAWHISKNDFVIGIAASGSTPYVVGAIQRCRQEGIGTGCITCNAQSKLEAAAEFPVVVVTGPEFVTGSTRLKAGTAQKLTLNMITTATFIRLGRVKGNKMVDMQLSNAKLVDRGTRMVMDELGIDEAEARERLLRKGNVRDAINDKEESD
jgi:N-acetylmuramic acid 6-phosphate etherase